ncbi:hypothetical protein P9D34_03720 [Bacillus swezeyi]|uniref:Uncharacterized protein n=1 Tax=Bacillus swezeyi TaxID=1925020 RepID=A0A1R1QCG0_9BACI|nr:hypothetical protein [Bacillus swezeyi]MEC1259567.1 hypothetical protein [Bacillus swezeyi]MED2927470.1 hypothetical protein [Bacillus swezeyi]MED2941722.1 hypothetical protein [Bacillus swezeyi]MED2962668.1 hypothetical protein [Bacillus swezeyi]MED2977271.1 hypothetical protein [Bacillus swezeyi]
MSQIMSVCKANFTFIKPYLYIYLCMDFVAFIINMFFSAAGINSHTEVSYANIATAFLFAIPVILPFFVYKQVLYLGASRKDYFFGTILLFTLSSFIFSLLNIGWYYVELHILVEFKDYFNIIHIFGWDQSGFLGMFFYQFFAYMLVTAALYLLFSAFWSKKGFVLWMAAAAIISVSTSIGKLREVAAEVIGFLLYNPSLLQSVGYELILTAILLFACWGLFIKQRQV